MPKVYDLIISRRGEEPEWRRVEDSEAASDDERLGLAIEAGRKLKEQLGSAGVSNEITIVSCEAPDEAGQQSDLLLPSTEDILGPVA